MLSSLRCVVAFLALVVSSACIAQTKDAPPRPVIVFADVRVFDGSGAALSAPSHVLVRGNVIERIAAVPFPAADTEGAVLIAGGGRTLMPGLIDAHAHPMMESIPQMDALTADIGYATRWRPSPPAPCCCAGSPACATWAATRSA